MMYQVNFLICNRDYVREVSFISGDKHSSIHGEENKMPLYCIPKWFKKYSLYILVYIYTHTHTYKYIQIFGKKRKGESKNDKTQDKMLTVGKSW